MGRIDAVFTQLAPQFGQSIMTDRLALDEAASWLDGTRNGELKHREVLVQSCQVQERPSVGVRRVDAMLQKENGFHSGNWSTNIQVSQMIRPYWQTECNGRLFEPGRLRQSDLKPAMESIWNSVDDLFALDKIQERLERYATTTRNASGLDEGTTLVRVMHLREKDTRHAHPSPVFTHGWFLIGERGQIRHEVMIGHSRICLAMMDRARADLSFERFDCRDLLKIEDGVEVFVDSAVEDRVRQNRMPDTVMAAPRG
ncbi:MAG: hypothetical protein EPN79_11490 [Burkholderiaceae bacterium]|nr:MAG: hypothetical protein EPN79_11490 [Burkholderiaceae bacterium]TBR76692.1 MAG: hypothetical protein EPN64_05575 [Burkholderiaceae bacterium]